MVQVKLGSDPRAQGGSQGLPGGSRRREGTGGDSLDRQFHGLTDCSILSMESPQPLLTLSQTEASHGPQTRTERPTHSYTQTHTMQTCAHAYIQTQTHVHTHRHVHTRNRGMYIQTQTAQRHMHTRDPHTHTHTHVHAHVQAWPRPHSPSHPGPLLWPEPHCCLVPRGPFLARLFSLGAPHSSTSKETRPVRGGGGSPSVLSLPVAESKYEKSLHYGHYCRIPATGADTGQTDLQPLPHRAASEL